MGRDLETGEKTPRIQFLGHIRDNRNTSIMNPIYYNTEANNDDQLFVCHLGAYL
jgi:hypothetical protein